MHIKLFFVTWLITSSQYCTSDFLHVWLGKAPASHSFPEFLSLPESPTYPLLPSLIKSIRKCRRQGRLNRDVFAHSVQKDYPNNGCVSPSVFTVWGTEPRTLCGFQVLYNQLQLQPFLLWDRFLSNCPGRPWTFAIPTLASGINLTFRPIQVLATA